ncbi:MAG: hypothetical protein ACREMQ_00475 [Longimicrobiales bacterium]
MNRSTLANPMPFDLLSTRAIVAMVIFAAVSVVLGSFLATAGGWRRAAYRFRAPAALPEATAHFRFVSMRMTGGLLGVASYHSCVTVGLSENGISLALWAPFRLFHPPLFIPWAAVEDCRPRPTISQDNVQIILRGGGGFQVYGRAATALSSWWPRRTGSLSW